MERENTRRSPRNRRTPLGKRRAPDPDIQYTQPKPFFRNRLIVQLLSIALFPPDLYSASRMGSLCHSHPGCMPSLFLPAH